MYRVFVIGLVVVVFSVSVIVGQSTFGSIVGVVHDKSQSVVPAASVQIKSLEDNSVRSTTADQDGVFEFLNLKPGSYSIAAQAPGFADFQMTSAELSARQALRIDIVLTVKSEIQTIQVQESAVAIDTENGVISDAKGTSQITQLPLNFRAATTSPLAAMSTSANVQQDTQGNVAVGGATANMVGFSVDGISTTNVFQSAAGTNPYPSSEGIAELKIISFNNSAEFAQVGDVTFTTKNGTNDLHGSLFEYLQNDALDARVLNFSIKAPKRFNTFGGSLGGPITIPHQRKRQNLLLFRL